MIHAVNSGNNGILNLIDEVDQDDGSSLQEEEDISDNQVEALSLHSSLEISNCSEDADEKNLSRLNESLVNAS